MDELIKQAESLGIKVFKSWDEDRLRAEIEAVVKANEAADAVDSEEPSLADDLPEPEPEPEAEAEDRTVTVRNLKANPMRALGLDSYGSATFTEAQLSADSALVKKIERGVELGLLKVETVE